MIDLSPYYGRVVYPDWSPEKIADEIARFTKFQIDELFRRGVDEWKNRQERGIDNILQGIITRKHDPILSVKELDQMLDEVTAKHKDKFSPEEIRSSGIHKFINHHSSNVYELFFYAHPRVTPEVNKKHQDVDFWIDGYFSFDLKVTTWPKAWDYASLKKRFEKLDYCINSPGPLVKWYYLNQGIHRWNWQNRLFIVCYDAQDFDHLRLKADFDNMKDIIRSYLDKFDPSKLVIVSQTELLGTVTTSNSKGRLIQETALADVIWNYKDYRIHPPRYPGGLAPMDGYQAVMF